MSLDLHHGFRFRDTSLPAIHAEIARLRSEASTIAHTLLVAHLAKEASGIFDRVSLALSVGEETKVDLTRSALSLAWEDYETRTKDIERSGYRDPEVDFALSLAVLPAGEQVLGLFYTEQDELEALVRASPLFEEYAYWNDTDDRPAGVDEEAWATRKEAWQRVLAPEGRWRMPAEAGLSAQIATRTRRSVPAEEVARKIAGPGERARRLAKDRLLSRKMVELAGGEEISVRNAGRLAIDASCWLREDADGQAALRVESAWVLARLHPEITSELLLAKLEGTARLTEANRGRAR